MPESRRPQRLRRVAEPCVPSPHRLQRLLFVEVVGDRHHCLALTPVLRYPLSSVLLEDVLLLLDSQLHLCGVLQRLNLLACRAPRAHLRLAQLERLDLLAALQLGQCLGALLLLQLLQPQRPLRRGRCLLLTHAHLCLRLRRQLRLVGLVDVSERVLQAQLPGSFVLRSLDLRLPNIAVQAALLLCHPVCEVLLNLVGDLLALGVLRSALLSQAALALRHDLGLLPSVFLHGNVRLAGLL
mmetsp:Transcript_10942/g.32547  ORF Transcript_10942/g.32547 Transcript_10942/m.32547 type:complete len:240 (-) Transcript_10942:985-1704(-)